jgi:hypothetical protein
VQAVHADACEPVSITQSVFGSGSKKAAPRGVGRGTGLFTCFTGNLAAAFVEQVFGVAKRKREADVEHHRQADDLRARLEVPEGGAFGDRAKLPAHPA